MSEGRTGTALPGPSSDEEVERVAIEEQKQKFIDGEIDVAELERRTQQIIESNTGSYRNPVAMPIDPPTVSGTEVSKDEDSR